MEECERLLDDVELFLKSESIVDTTTPQNEEIKYRDALERMKRKDYVRATQILSKLVENKKTSGRNDLWNLGTRLNLRALCYERRGLNKFAEMDREKSRCLRDEWKKTDPKRLKTIKHVDRFASASDFEALLALMKTISILVLLYTIAWINTTTTIFVMIILGLVRMRCFILFHDCTECWSENTALSHVPIIHSR